MSTYTVYGGGAGDISDMAGKTFVSATGNKGDEQLVFVADDGLTFRFFHYENCCESVTIDDFVGDLADLVGSPIVEAEEISSEPPALDYTPESCTWTFYRFSTAKGTVTVRWFGQSNGYYSEDVALSITRGEAS